VYAESLVSNVNIVTDAARGGVRTRS
jgi:hypothetical protein